MTMKTLRFSILIAMFFASFSLLAQSSPQNSFDLMKSLAGSWEGKSTMGQGPVNVSYRLTSGGSALMSEIQMEMKGKSEDMITMIHLDGNRLLLTHYCATGNQPRMQASASPDGKTITFDFLDATNLSSPDAAHMRSVVFTFLDASHHTEAWHFTDHGKDIIANLDLKKKS